MLVFAALTPNTPLLLPSISKEKAPKVAQTTEAMAELARELYATHPDTIVLISSQPTMYDDSFSLNLSDPYAFDLKAFGDLGFEKKMRPDIMLVDRLQRSLRSQGQQLTLTSDVALDYATAIPLQLLTEQLDVQLLPLAYCGRSAKDHFQFGQALKDALFDSNKRIAVIASGDMSHALTSDAPAGFHKDGPEFDAKIQELVAQKNTAGLLQLDESLVTNASERSYKPLTMLFGLLERISVNPHVLSYEAPFGVGYLVVNFVMR